MYSSYTVINVKDFFLWLFEKYKKESEMLKFSKYKLLVPKYNVKCNKMKVKGKMLKVNSIFVSQEVALNLF